MKTKFKYHGQEVTEKTIIRKRMDVEVKASGKNTYIFTASTVAVDRMGDTIEQTGWELQNFLKNPVIPWGHNYAEPPIGKSVRTWISDDKLQIEVEFASKIYPFAKLIEDLVREGFLKSVSVGFRPIKAEPNDDGGMRFIKQELLEVSVVTVPANQEALAQMQAKGIDTKSAMEQNFIEIVDKSEDKTELDAAPTIEDITDGEQDTAEEDDDESLSIDEPKEPTEPGEPGDDSAVDGGEAEETQGDVTKPDDTEPELPAADAAAAPEGDDPEDDELSDNEVEIVATDADKSNDAGVTKDLELVRIKEISEDRKMRLKDFRLYRDKFAEKMGLKPQADEALYNKQVFGFIDQLIENQQKTIETLESSQNDELIEIVDDETE
jgi:HK97 family phage prohead protease